VKKIANTKYDTFIVAKVNSKITAFNTLLKLKMNLCGELWFFVSFSGVESTTPNAGI